MSDEPAWDGNSIGLRLHMLVDEMERVGVIVDEMDLWPPAFDAVADAKSLVMASSKDDKRLHFHVRQCRVIRAWREPIIDPLKVYVGDACLPIMVTKVHPRNHDYVNSKRIVDRNGDENNWDREKYDALGKAFHEATIANWKAQQARDALEYTDGV